MFCGLSATYASEDEAIQHMAECPALLEQLDDKAQFTLPSRENMNHDIDIPKGR